MSSDTESLAGAAYREDMADNERMTMHTSPDNRYASLNFLASLAGFREDGATDKGNGNFFTAQKFRDLRSIARCKRNTDGTRSKLEPGDDSEAWEPYPVFATGNNDFADFGLGIALYFATLKIMGCCMIVCFFINTYLLGYYSSDEYSGGDQDSSTSALIPGDLVGSAWCPDSQKRGSVPRVGGGNITVYDCPFDESIGFLDFTSTLVVMCTVLGMTYFQDKIANALDEAQQTAEDYSIEVEDPGESDEDYDPYEWKRFFEQFGEVVSVTIAVKNGKLMKLLAYRKALIYKCVKAGWHLQDDPDFVPDEPRKALINGDDMDLETFRSLASKEPISPLLLIPMKAGFGRSVQFNCEKLIAVNAQIKARLTEFADNRPIPARVFVTFDLEESQRKCLATLRCGSVFAFLDQENPTFVQTEEALACTTKQFHGNVLRVLAGPEPEDVKWENLDIEPMTLYFLSMALNFVAFCVVIVMAYIVKALSDSGNTGLTAIFISFSNIMLPTTMKIINSYEPHATNTNLQASLLFKIVAARWTISALVVYAITYWSDTTEVDKLKSIMAILMADAVTSPAIRVLDVFGKIKRYALAPFARTQEAMNSLYLGGSWFLAERFSDMTKTVFICMFYSAVMPAAFLVTSFALFLNYWVDKYLLLRSWQVPPLLNAKIVKTTQAHLACVVLVHCIISLHYFAGFPFDHVGTPNADGEYEWVDKNLWNEGIFIVFGTRDWMSSSQKNVSRFYQVFCIIGVIIVVTYYSGRMIQDTLYTLFIGQPSDDTEIAVRPAVKGERYYLEDDYGNPISEAIKASDPDVDLNGYIPQMEHPALDYPQVATYLPFDHSEENTLDPSDKETPVFTQAMLTWNVPRSLSTVDLNGEPCPVTYRGNNLYADPILRDVANKQRLFSLVKVFKQHRAAFVNQTVKQGQTAAPSTAFIPNAVAAPPAPAAVEVSSLPEPPMGAGSINAPPPPPGAGGGGIPLAPPPAGIPDP